MIKPSTENYYPKRKGYELNQKSDHQDFSYLFKIGEGLIAFNLKSSFNLIRDRSYLPVPLLQDL